MFMKATSLSGLGLFDYAKLEIFLSISKNDIGSSEL